MLFPHHENCKKGDFLILDFGAKYKGYHADMTRTIVIKECDEKQKEIYNIVYKSQRLGAERLLIIKNVNM